MTRNSSGRRFLMSREDRDVSGPAAPVPGGDYEYDMAHDAEWAAASGRPGRTEDREHVHVEVRTDDDQGDYGYDMAHDMGPG
jgi:hypothetical protein